MFCYNKTFDRSSKGCIHMFIHVFSMFQRVFDLKTPEGYKYLQSNIQKRKEICLSCFLPFSLGCSGASLATTSGGILGFSLETDIYIYI